MQLVSSILLAEGQTTINHIKEIKNFFIAPDSLTASVFICRVGDLGRYMKAWMPVKENT